MNTNLKFTNLKKKDNHKVFYNRSENKYYLYDTNDSELYNIDMKSTNDRGKHVWPSISCTIENKVSSKYWEQKNIEIYTNNKDETMVSYIVNEKIECYSNKADIRDKNFQELMEYAINVKREDPSAWNYFESQRIKDSLFNVLVSAYDLTHSSGSEQLITTFTEKVTSGSGENEKLKKAIDNGTAIPILTDDLLEIARKNNDKEMVERYLKIKKNLPKFEPLTSEQVSKNIDLRNKFFFLIGEDKLEKIKKVLIEKYDFERSYLEEMKNPSEISKLYNEYTIKDKNKKKEKVKVKYNIV